MDACVFFLRQRVISACPTFSWALETSWRRTQACPSPQYNVSLVLAQYLCSVNWWPELSPLLYTDQLNFKKKKKHTLLFADVNGNCGASYLFDKHILLHFTVRGHHDASLWKNPRTFSSFQQKGSMHFHLQISELILCAASVPYIPGSCALKSRAMNTPMKNDASEPAPQCSEFESALNNNQDQHWL